MDRLTQLQDGIDAVRRTTRGERGTIRILSITNVLLDGTHVDQQSILRS